MKRNIIVAMTSASVLLSATCASFGQVAGSTQLGVAAAELREITKGWSAKRQIMGQTVYNDKEGSDRSRILSLRPTKPSPTPSSARAASSVLASTTWRSRLVSSRSRMASSFLRVQPRKRSRQCQNSNTHGRPTAWLPTLATQGLRLRLVDQTLPRKAPTGEFHV